jgi:serine protease Do
MTIHRLAILLILVPFIGTFCLTPSHADQLQLDNNQYWVTLASRQEVDEAIAFARRYQQQKARVVSSLNGWYAILIGPIAVLPQSGRPTLDALIKKDTLPADAFLTSGNGFVDTLWTTPKNPVLWTLGYDGKTDATFEDSDLRVTLSKMPANETNDFFPTAKGYVNDQLVFEMKFTDISNESPITNIKSVRLNTSSEHPQVVFTYYWQGAHCCTLTKIATEVEQGVWKIVDGETLDGDVGYRFEDVDETGSAALLSIDQAFLYAFDSYAGSYSPTKIHKLDGEKLIDLTDEQRFHHRLLQELYNMLPDKASGDTWHSNGFLAGWVAASVLVGEGPSSWSVMLQNYDHNSDFGPEECSVGVPLDKCPQDNIVKKFFPEALKQFLIEKGYISDLSDYPLPVGERPSAPPALDNTPSTPEIPTSMHMCVDSLNVVRDLIVQAFLNRKLNTSEHYDVVTLDDDTTVEDLNQPINKVTCAVTYKLDLKQLIGLLAQNGYMQTAYKLNHIAISSGSTIERRIRFTVKPTAKEGSTWIELLP